MLTDADLPSLAGAQIPVLRCTHFMPQAVMQCLGVLTPPVTTTTVCRGRSSTTAGMTLRD